MWILARRADEKLIFKGQGHQKHRKNEAGCPQEAVQVFGAVFFLHVGQLLVQKRFYLDHFDFQHDIRKNKRFLDGSDMQKHYILIAFWEPRGVPRWSAAGWAQTVWDDGNIAFRY